MKHGVESFVVKRSNIPPSAATRRQIAAGLKIKQTPTVHQMPQRNQPNDSSQYTGTSGPGIDQNHIGQVKDEQADSQRGIPGDTQRFSNDGYSVDGRYAFKGNVHARDVQADIRQDLFDTDVGEDFDRSISDAQVPDSHRGFQGQKAIQHQDELGSQSGESLLEDDDDNSGLGEDDGDEVYTRDPDQTVTINENTQMDQVTSNVALRTKPEGQTRFQTHGQHIRGNPRSRMLEELGSYPVAITVNPENVEGTRYTDITGSLLGGQSMPQRQGTSRTQFRRGEGPGSYYGSSDEGEEHGTVRSSQTPGVMIARASPGKGAKRGKHEEQLDYPLTALEAMTYDQLRSQPFDTDPNANPLILPPDLSSASLSDQLTHISTLPEEQKRQFFSSLSLDSWESCGDWFVDRFAGVVKKMTELRKEKRKVAIDFEEEIASRQERVRAKTEHLRTVMSRMQREGKVLLEEKTA